MPYVFEKLPSHRRTPRPTQKHALTRRTGPRGFDAASLHPHTFRSDWWTMINCQAFTRVLPSYFTGESAWQKPRLMGKSSWFLQIRLNAATCSFPHHPCKWSSLQDTHRHEEGCQRRHFFDGSSGHGRDRAGWPPQRHHCVLVVLVDMFWSSKKPFLSGKSEFTSAHLHLKSFSRCSCCCAEDHLPNGWIKLFIQQGLHFLQPKHQVPHAMAMWGHLE